MSLISRKNGRRVLFGVVPLPVAIGVTAIGAGVALAAVLLTTTISGSATVRTLGTSNELTVVPSAVNGSALDCSNLTISEDFKKLTFNPVLTRTVNGGNSDTVPIKGGECTITLKVKNTGTSTIQVAGSSGFTVPDVGWEITALSGDALSPIAPGATASVSATLKASEAAVTGGQFGGQLVYTD